MPGVGNDVTGRPDSGAQQPQPSGLTLAPFRGTRFFAARIGDVAAATAPPYDLIGDADVERLTADSPYNVARLTLARGTGDREWRYRQAGSELRHWLAEGILGTDPEPALYVYEERGAGKLQRGLIGAVALTGPETGVVLPHEDVVPEIVDDRLAHMRATRANLEPIFLTYSGGGQASRLVDEIATTRPPLHDVACEDGMRHRLWAVTEPAEKAHIDADVHSRRALIADGHHRYATYLALQAEQHASGRGAGPWDFGLALLVDATSYPPYVGAMHRVIPGLEPRRAAAAVNADGAWRAVPAGGTLAAALEALRDAARDGPAFVIAGSGEHHLLSMVDSGLLERRMPTNHSLRWRRLPTSTLHALLIPHVWGIDENPRSVRVVHDDAETAIRMASENHGTAVLVPSLDVETVHALATEGERVPRKSTSFEPKPRTGLVLRVFGTEP